MMKAIVEDRRREIVREGELRGHSGGGRAETPSCGRQPGPAYPANVENRDRRTTGYAAACGGAPRRASAPGDSNRDSNRRGRN